MCYPRLLVVDCTKIGADNATGQIKKTFTANWPKSKLLQVWHRNVWSKAEESEGFQVSFSKTKEDCDLNTVLNICRDFNPEVAYIRTVDSVLFMQAAQTIVTSIKVPYAVHIMDDWLNWLAKTKDDSFAILAEISKELVENASFRWAICEKMALYYAKQYSKHFEVLANGVDIVEFSAGVKSTETNNPLIVRYTGGISRRVNFDSIVEIAQVISDLRKELNVELHIHAVDWCKRDVKKQLENVDGIRIFGLVSESEYYETLRRSDVLIIAYNFDEKSKAYSHLSFANKTPELLASGVPVLAYGPCDMATIEYLSKNDCACVVNQHDLAALKKSFFSTLTDFDLRAALSSKARETVREKMSKKRVVNSFYNGLVQTQVCSLSKKGQ